MFQTTNQIKRGFLFSTKSGVLFWWTHQYHQCLDAKEISTDAILDVLRGWNHFKWNYIVLKKYREKLSNSWSIYYQCCSHTKSHRVHTKWGPQTIAKTDSIAKLMIVLFVESNFTTVDDIYDIIWYLWPYEGFRKWGVPPKWMVYKGKSH